MSDGLTDKERSGIQAVLAGYPKVRRAILFGSRALGSFQRTSDVDLALEGEDLGLQDLLTLKARIAELNLTVDVDFLIRATIRNPELEEHIGTKGIEWYRSQSTPTQAT